MATSQEMAGGGVDALESIKGQTRKALDEVKKDVESGKSVNIDSALDYVRNNSDLTPEQWEKVKNNVHKQIEDAILSQTTEGRKLGSFTQEQAAAGAEAAAKDPERAKQIADQIAELFGKDDKQKKSLTGMAGMISGFFEWLKSGDKSIKNLFAKLFPKPDKEDDKKKQVAEDAKKKKDEQPKAKPAEAQSEAKKDEKASEAVTDEKKYIDMFKAKGWTLDTTNLAQDLQSLKNGGIDASRIEEEIGLAAANGSNLKQIYEAVKSVLPNDTFKLRVTDLLYKSLDKAALDERAAVIKGKIGKKPEDIRKFLDDTYAAKSAIALKGVIEAYKA